MVTRHHRSLARIREFGEELVLQSGGHRTRRNLGKECSHSRQSLLLIHSLLLRSSKKMIKDVGKSQARCKSFRIHGNVCVCVCF